MTTSGNGNDAKGGKPSVKKAGKPGTHIKRMSDVGSGTGSRSEGKGKTGIDQVFKTLGDKLERNKKVESVRCGIYGVTKGLENDKRNPVKALQQIVDSREKEVNEIESKIDGTHNISERSTLAVQLKGAQHALKEALVNLSLVQKNTESSTVVAWRLEEDEKTQEATANKEGEDMTEGPKAHGVGLKGDDKEKVENNSKMRVVDTQDSNMEFYVDYEEDKSDDEVVMYDTVQKQVVAIAENDDEDMAEDNKVSKIAGEMENKAWEDCSDDETVKMNTTNDNSDEEWKTVESKKSKKTKKDESKKNHDENEGTNQIEDKTIIENPYNKPRTKLLNQNTKTTQKQDNTPNTNKSSLTTYMEITKEKLRTPNKESIRFTTSFTPRLSGAGEYKRIAKELLAYATDFAPEAMLLPWDDHSGLGPINVEDLNNPRNYTDTIKYYFHTPNHVTMQPGTPAYGIGLRFSVNSGKYEFLNKWNMKKRDYKQRDRAAHTITLAPMQNSPTSYIVGIAVGSSEHQDMVILNQRLEKATGIPGIEVSYQNVHQTGITAEFWKLANNKASSANKEKNSREYLRTKYLWAPNAIALYVPKREQVPIARKILLQEYGKPLKGEDPVWPDGSSMRFLPVKGSAIQNDKTNDIVRKRMAYHIWMKANEIVINTNLVNIHETIDGFNGKSFSEIILEIEDETGARLFSHFNRAWSNDPRKTKWGISVKANMVTKAEIMIQQLKETLVDMYGQEIDSFFEDGQTKMSYWDAVQGKPKNTSKDDDDNWFEEEDDIDELIKKGIVDTTFVQFLTGQQDSEDKDSVVSWGTGDSTYTELIDHRVSTSGSVSSLTQETNISDLEIIAQRKGLVKEILTKQGIMDEELITIMTNQEPYELAFSGIQLSSWDPTKEAFIIMAIRSSTKNNPPNNKKE